MIWKLFQTFHAAFGSHLLVLSRHRVRQWMARVVTFLLATWDIFPSENLCETANKHDVSYVSPTHFLCLVFAYFNAFKLPTLKFGETKNLESDPGHSSPCLLRRHWNNQGKSSEKAWHHVASASKIIKHIFGCGSSTSCRTLWQLLAILVLSAGGNVYWSNKGQTRQKNSYHTSTSLETKTAGHSGTPTI